MRYRTLDILVITLIVAVLAALMSTRWQVGVADGWYDLTVELDPSLTSDVKSLSYVAVRDESMAKTVSAKYDECASEIEHRSSAAPFQLNVGYSFRVLASGEMTEGSQEYSHIIIVLHLLDGSRRAYLLEVPHRDISRRIMVRGRDQLP